MCGFETLINTDKYQVRISLSSPKIQTELIFFGLCFYTDHLSLITNKKGKIIKSYTLCANQNNVNNTEQQG